MFIIIMVAVELNHYLESLDVLEPKSGDIPNYLVLDLFAGCGGLSLGFESIGFKTIGYESKKDAVDTYNKNLNGFVTVMQQIFHFVFI